MRVLLRRWLKLIAIVVFLGWSASASGIVVGASDTDEITWQIEIRVSFTADQINQPGWEENTRALQSALTARLQSHGTRLETSRAPNARGTELTLRADGKGNAAQFKRVAFDDLTPVGGLIGGPAALTLNGAVKRGENVSLVLESNPSTGYSWEASQADAAMLQSTGQPQFQQKANMPGAPAKQTIRLHAAHDGNASLTLVYRRPWETEEPTRRISLRATRLGSLADVTDPVVPSAAQSALPDLPVRAPTSVDTLPSYFNWADSNNWKGASQVTPIRNQGSCGSCWAFATVGPFESNILIKDNVSTNLSEQYLVSCNTDGWSCNGGWWAHDYHQWKKVSNDTVAGAVYETSFPYVAYNAPCNAPYSHPYHLTTWAFVGSSNSVPSADAIKNAIYTYGPVAVGICAGNTFSYYSGGVFSTNECSSINHAVVLVGWNDVDNTWILRNSWGTNWGESGYMRIVRGTSLVGYGATYVVYSGTLSCYNLTTTSSPAAGGGIKASPSPNCNTTQYAQGTVVSLTAVPTCAHTFLNWSGALSGSANPTTLTMSGNQSVTANFGAFSSTCYFFQLPFVQK